MDRIFMKAIEITLAINNKINFVKNCLNLIYKIMQIIIFTKLFVLFNISMMKSKMYFYLESKTLLLNF